MSDLPWFQFFASDWLSGTRGLSAVETGIYITLIASMYDKEGPLQNDTERLARLCGASPRQFRAALARLLDDGKILIVDEKLWNSRVEEQLQLRAAKSEKAKQSVETRWNGKTQQNQKEKNTDVKPEYISSDTNQNQSQKEEVELSARASDTRETIHQPTDDWDVLRDQLCEAAGWQTARALGKLEVVGPIVELLRAGANLELDVLPVIRRDAARCDTPTWKFFLKAIARARDDRVAAGNLKTISQNHGGSHAKPKSNADSANIVIGALDTELERVQAEIDRQEGHGDTGQENAGLLSGLRQSAA